MSLVFRAALAALVVAFIALAPVASAAAPVPPDAGKAVTFPFPAKAPVVVQLTGIGSARERLSVLLKAALPADAKEVDKHIDEALKELLAGRKLTAVPPEGRVYLVVNNLESLFENAPAVSLLVPVTGYKAFRESFLTADEQKTFEEKKGGVDEVKLTAFGGDHAVYMVDLKDYVAVSPDRTTAAVYATKFDRAATTLMPGELARSFVGSDVAVYVNLDAINQTYAEQIKGFKGVVDFGIQQLLMNGGMVPGLGKKQIESLKGLAESGFQALDDCRGLVVAAEFRPEGLNLRVQAQFDDATATAKLLKGEAPGPLVELGKLPAGLGQYGGTKLGPKFADALRGLNPEFVPADDDEKGTAAVEDKLKALAAAGPQGEVSGTGGADTLFTAAKYADPKKALDARLGCYEAMAAGGRAHGAVLKGAPKVTRAARKHGDFAFAEVKLAFDFEATVKDLPDGLKESTVAQLKRTLAENTTVWVGTDGKTVLQVTAKDWAAASAAVDNYTDGKKPVGDAPGFKLTRKNLPADANYLMMLETGHTIATLLDSVRAMEGVVPGFPKLGKAPDLKGDPTFVGVALTLKGSTATLNVFVPAGAIGVGRAAVAGLLTKIE